MNDLCRTGAPTRGASGQRAFCTVCPMSAIVVGAATANELDAAAIMVAAYAFWTPDASSPPSPLPSSHMACGHGAE